MRTRALILAVLFGLVMLPAASHGGLFDFLKKGKDKKEQAEPVRETVVPDEPAGPAEPHATTGDEFVPPEGAVRTEEFRDDFKTDSLDEAPVIVLEPEEGPEEGAAGPDEFFYEDYDPELDPDYYGEEDPGPAEPFIDIEEVLLGASTDLALLKLARAYSGKGDARKAALAYQRIISDFPGSSVKFEALHELGYLRYRAGRLKEARMLLKSVASSWSAGYALKEKSRELIKEIDTIYYRGGHAGSKLSIGVLLPVGGRYAKFGEAALSGVLLAAETFSGGSVPVEVYVRDVGPEPEGLMAAMDDLVMKKKVRGLLGPLFSSSSAEAARYAQNQRIPIVTLAQKSGLTGTGDFVFRNALMPEEQARLVASYAYEVMGSRKFSILYPENSYGVGLARAFADTVKELGADVVSVATYPAGTQDFAEQLRAIFGIEEQETKEGRRTIKEYTPLIEVDALYVPDYYQSVSLMVPYMEYFNIKGVALLGSNGWNSDKLAAYSGKGVEGAVFTDAFFSGSTRPGTVEFRERFKKTFRREPGAIEAQSFDAASALISALAEEDFKWTTRDRLRDRLKAGQAVEGSVGAMAFDERREAKRELYLLSVYRGRIIEISGTELPPGWTPPEEEEFIEGGDLPEKGGALEPSQPPLREPWPGT